MLGMSQERTGGEYYQVDEPQVLGVPSADIFSSPEDR